MRAVKSLIEELKKFPEDAMCYAYEGEICGIVVIRPNEFHSEMGTIHCSEGQGIDCETEMYG